MTNTIQDLFIIGGGINGTGIAADAANRGLTVTLCEKGDLAVGTSSCSSKLIHGGIRYLEHYEFSLVRKALKEREVVLNKAPHITKALQFIMPHAPHLRPSLLIRAGLFLYDHLARRKTLEGSKQLNLSDLSGTNPLKDEFKIGFSYADGWVDDARLVVLNALSAQEQGATVLVKTECKKVTQENDYWHIELFNHLTKEISVVKAKTIVNAAGPWVNIVLENAFKIRPHKTMQWIKGSHIVVPKLYDGEHAYILQNPDKRVIFVIPFENKFSLIGTTDVPYHDSEHLDHIQISEEEIDYLCNAVGHYFKNTIDKKSILWSYAGVRPLFGDPEEDPSSMTRDYSLELHDGLLTVYGGKITTYRILAEQVLEKLKSSLPHMNSNSTINKKLPGGDVGPDFEHELKKQYPWLPSDIALRYAHSYGARAHRILNHCHSLVDLGQHFEHGLYEKEVRYLMAEEWAHDAEDVLWRRTKLGLYFTEEERKVLEGVIANPKQAW